MGCELILYYGVGLILKGVKIKKRLYHKRVIITSCIIRHFDVSVESAYSAPLSCAVCTYVRAASSLSSIYWP